MHKYLHTMNTACIIDPPIPYMEPIRTRFNPGKAIEIEGTVPSTASGFTIKLQCGSQTAPQDDIAIQIAVKILDEYIALNSLENGTWGTEQRMLSLPIKRNEKFKIVLLCKFNQYKVIINNQPYCYFLQRIHFYHISHLVIDGDVVITRISYTSATAPFFGSIPDNTEVGNNPLRPRMQPPSYETTMFAGPQYPTGGNVGLPLSFLSSPEFANIETYYRDFLTPQLRTPGPVNTPMSNTELLEGIVEHKKCGLLWLCFLLIVGAITVLAMIMSRI